MPGIGSTKLQSGAARKAAMIVVWALALVVVLATGAEAQFLYQSDGGFFDLEVTKAGKLKKQKIFWIWIPHYRPGSVTYEIFAECDRRDADGNFVGNNKVTFSNIKFLGGGGTQLNVPKLGGKLKNGIQAKLLNREVSPLGILAGTGSAIIGEATVLVKGKLAAGDRIVCKIDVTESQ